HLRLGASPPPARSRPFPYTTLFRAPLPRLLIGMSLSPAIDTLLKTSVHFSSLSSGSLGFNELATAAFSSVSFSKVRCATSSSLRSEEHTSELQSREKLVCRLLLEQK